MTLTAKDVAEIMRILEESSFEELSLELDGVKLKLQRASAARPALDPPPPPSPPNSVEPIPQPPPSSGWFEVPSPLIGVFYLAPRPGEPPFVELGSKVVEETVIGIIEVMKLMNTVRAGVKGEVVQILVRNGAPVEFGEILMRVRPEA